MVLTTHPLLAPRSRMSRAIPLLWAFGACYRANYIYSLLRPTLHFQNINSARIISHAQLQEDIRFSKHSHAHVRYEIRCVFFFQNLVSKFLHRWCHNTAYVVFLANLMHHATRLRTFILRMCAGVIVKNNISLTSGISQSLQWLGYRLVDRGIGVRLSTWAKKSLLESVRNVYVARLASC
jgi:hypothetical protein